MVDGIRIQAGLLPRDSFEQMPFDAVHGAPFSKKIVRRWRSQVRRLVEQWRRANGVRSAKERGRECNPDNPCVRTTWNPKDESVKSLYRPPNTVLGCPKIRAQRPRECRNWYSPFPGRPACPPRIDDLPFWNPFFTHLLLYAKAPRRGVRLRSCRNGLNRRTPASSVRCRTYRPVLCVSVPWSPDRCGRAHRIIMTTA